MGIFAAIDFETADYRRDSACSVGVALVQDGRIIQTYQRLIRPPRKEFVFTHIHGLTWDDVRNSPTFGQMWPELREIINWADFLVAHNAPFDRGVLHTCCEAAGLTPPTHDFRCTMKMARAKWNLSSAKLSAVCDHLGIELNHHEALSDAVACAKIAVEAMR